MHPKFPSAPLADEEDEAFVRDALDNGLRKHSIWSLLVMAWFFGGWTISILPWIYLDEVFGLADLIVCTVLAIAFWFVSSIALLVCVIMFHKPKLGSEAGA